MRLQINIKKILIPLFFLSLSFSTLYAQSSKEAKHLRGSITPEREWWDLKHYALKVQIDPNIKSISGSNQIRFEVLHTNQKRMQIDLQPPMQIDSILYQNTSLSWERIQAVHYINFSDNQNFRKQQRDSFLIYFSGKPTEAMNPPWDGE